MAARPDRGTAPESLWKAGLKALVGSLAATLVVRSLALAAFAIPPEFPPLAGPGSTIVFTTAGALGATGVLAVIRWRSERPARLFRRVALWTLLASLVPDLWLLTDAAATAFPGATAAGVGTLMAMHLAAAAAIVWALAPARSG